MKKLIILIILMLSAWLTAYEINNYEVTFIDSSRNNRQINTKIYYPISQDKPSGREESFPKIIFGHGWLTSPDFYIQLPEYLASEGYIIALPYTESGLFPNHNEFALDLVFLASALAMEGENENSPIYMQVGQEAIVSGHSMGGGASVLAAGLSNVFSAVFNFAAAETSPSAINNADGVTIPALFFAGANDTVAPPDSNQEPMFYNLSSEYKSLVTLNNEGHIDITGNELALSLSIPYLNYVVTGLGSYKEEFEGLLDSYQDNEDIDYIIENNVSNSNQVETPREDVIITNYPNPFNPNTNISFELDRNYPDLQLRIYNLKGQLVRQLKNIQKEVKEYQVSWNGLDNKGKDLASGLYLCILKSSNHEIARGKMILRK